MSGKPFQPKAHGVIDYGFLAANLVAPPLLVPTEDPDGCRRRSCSPPSRTRCAIRARPTRASSWAWAFASPSAAYPGPCTSFSA